MLSCATGFLGLRSSLLTFQIFVRLLCLIVQNVAEISNLTSGVRVRARASHAEDVSGGSLMGLEFDSFLCWSTMRKQGKSCFLLVFILFHSKSSTMAAAGAVWRVQLPDGSI